MDLIPRLNTALAGRYRIDRELGEGGMAVEWHRGLETRRRDRTRTLGSDSLSTRARRSE